MSRVPLRLALAVGLLALAMHAHAQAPPAERLTYALGDTWALSDHEGRSRGRHPAHADPAVRGGLAAMSLGFAAALVKNPATNIHQLVSGDDHSLLDADSLLIDDGRIAAIGRDLDDPARAAEVVKGPGCE